MLSAIGKQFYIYAARTEKCLEKEKEHCFRVGAIVMRLLLLSHLSERNSVPISEIMSKTYKWLIQDVNRWRNYYNSGIQTGNQINYSDNILLCMAQRCQVIQEFLSITLESLEIHC